MLETKIDALTKAIEALTAAMQSTKQEIKELSEQTIEPTIEPVVGPVVEPVAVEVNHADLRDAILKANRSNLENKVLIKEMLTKYKATKVSEVAEQDIALLINEIEGLCK